MKEYDFVAFVFVLHGTTLSLPLALVFLRCVVHVKALSWDVTYAIKLLEAQVALFTIV